MGDTIRQKADISSLLAEKFDWTCETDEIMAEALGKQVSCLAIASEAYTLVLISRTLGAFTVDRSYRSGEAATSRQTGFIAR